MNKEKDQANPGVDTPRPPQHMDPSKKLGKGKSVIGDKKTAKKKKG